MTIEKIVEENRITLKLDGWLDTKTAPQLYDVIAQIEPDGKTLALDFEKLEYISSAGIRQIVYGYKKMDGKFLLKNVNESIMGILASIGLDKKITIE